ncbi:hypothetical protein C9374_004510 [Naegleria lovaniensis]|uniref:Protein kinase domain-containing protein n=1 Tax=Naegleria lovaniensis TaxID=51637 RepID=A0AA88GS60_NAELO|nr:uncharacterized protein C9374_004510 [Naegleria lovaniensis]KAG2383173.1 hypothetical protein C9374_004510 [Naegleria lovaniensis]
MKNFFGNWSPAADENGRDNDTLAVDTSATTSSSKSSSVNNLIAHDAKSNMSSPSSEAMTMVEFMAASRAEDYFDINGRANRHRSNAHRFNSPQVETAKSEILNDQQDVHEKEFVKSDVIYMFEAVKENAKKISIMDDEENSKSSLIDTLNQCKYSFCVSTKKHDEFCGQHLLPTLNDQSTVRLILKKDYLDTLDVSKIKSIYSRYETTFFVCDSLIWVAGSNEHYRLGLGHNLPLTVVPSILRHNFNNKEIKKICILRQSTVFLTEDNMVYACGENLYVKAPYDTKPKMPYLESSTYLTSGIGDAVNTENCIFFLTLEGTVLVAGHPDTTGPFFATLTESQSAVVSSTLTIRVITSLFGKEIVKISCSDDNGVTLMCLAKDYQTVWCLGNNLNGIFGIGFAKNFTTPKELTYFKENDITLQDIYCKGGECFFLTTTGRVYQTGGSPEFYIPKQILIEHTIVTIEEDGIFKSSHGRYLFSCGMTKAIGVYKYFNDRFQLLHNAFLHFLDTHTASDLQDIFSKSSKEVKSGEIVVVPKPVLFGCHHFFDPCSELPFDPLLEKSFSKTTIGGTTFFEATENLKTSMGLHNANSNYIQIPNSTISSSLFVSFLNSQPIHKLIVGEFSSSEYELTFYQKDAFLNNVEKDLMALSEFFGIEEFSKLIAVSHLISHNYNKEINIISNSEELSKRENYDIYNSLFDLYKSIAEPSSSSDDTRTHIREQYFSSLKPHFLPKQIQYAFDFNLTIWIIELYCYIAEQTKYTDMDAVNTFNVVQNMTPSTFEEFKQYCYNILNLPITRENRKDVSRFLSKQTAFNYVAKAETVFIAVALCLAIKMLSNKEILSKSVFNVDSEHHILLSATLTSFEESVSKLFQKEGLSGYASTNKKINEKQISNFVLSHMLNSAVSLIRDLNKLSIENKALLLLKHLVMNVLSNEGPKWKPPNMTVFGNHYILLKKAGEGAEGSVFKCFDRTTMSFVALKRYNEVMDQEKIKEINRHLDLVMKLSVHKNLVTVLKKFVERKGEMFNDYGLNVVMNYIPHGTLYDHLNTYKNNPSMPYYPEWLSFAIDIASGMEQLHYQNFIYRDLKSENVLLDSDSTGSLVCKISDFGLLTRWDPRMSVSRKGTPLTMAPEYMDSNVLIDKACDIFSLGCVIYELLTLERDLTINGQRFLFHEAIRNNQSSAHARICKVLEGNGFPPLVQRLIISMIQRKIFLRPQAHQVVRILESFRDDGFFTLEKQLEQLLLALPVVSDSLTPTKDQDRKRYTFGLLNGRYKILGKLDAESDACIRFLCADTKSNDKEVLVLVFLHFGVFCNHLSKYQFHHRHIMQKIEEFSEDKSFGIVTSYLNGGNLLSFIKSKDSSSQGNVDTTSPPLNVMMQCCDAIVHIHERKKVHLGICPENILYQLSSWKNIDVMVEALDNVTDIVELERSLPKQLHYNVFIPEYHATHSNKELSFASDIFCLGVVFYQLLTRDLVSVLE